MNKPISLTKLCTEYGFSLNAASIFNALIKLNVMREVEYSSTTGSGKIKKFKEILPNYSNIGINSPSSHEFKTEPLFFPEAFPELIKLVIKQLDIESNSIK